jgi:hypothetical protein
MERGLVTTPPNRTEAGTYWRYISNSLDRLVALALEIDDEGLIWRPPAANSNNVAGLTIHTLGNAEENILETLCGQPRRQNRSGEFSRQTTRDELRARWGDLRARIEEALSELPAAALDEDRAHPRRGVISGRDVLIVVARHAAEHLGQAELTRDLWKAHPSG